ncbi:hypothetical protein BGZ50_001787 [Haplosporangium sp. Z 11]|nr:hypothetical protein BGZ50_001787 [Haplosporangium sp. Z 11]
MWHAHVQCTESFYKSSVMNELKSSPSVTPQDQRKMRGILDRFEKQAIEEEQLLDMSDEDLLQHAQARQQGHAQKQTEQMQHQSGTEAVTRRKLTPKERDELIGKVIQEENDAPNADPDMDPADREMMEHQLEQEYQEFVNRFAGVDLEQESFESIWARLSSEERREFQEKFMISGGRFDDEDMDDDTVEQSGEPIAHDSDNEEEELEAKELLEQMGATLKRGGERTGKDSTDPMLADLDSEDLKAIRDAEISELIPIWRPWWEVEAKEAEQLKKVVVSKVTDNQDSQRLEAATIVTEPSYVPTNTNSIPKEAQQASSTASETVLEEYVLNEEAMLRPHYSLVRSVEDIEEEKRQLEATTITPMVKEPHPSLIYHVCALLFAYAATSRVLNGDLKEEPEQSLAYIFDICPFFAPPPPSTTVQESASPTRAPQVPDIEDFETTLAVLQRSSLDSKLWKGDTLRLDMLSLLLRDLILILARPSRCVRSVRELKDVFTKCLKDQSRAPQDVSVSGASIQPAQRKRTRLFSKSVLHRLSKKLEFYESFLLSDEWILKSDRLDRARTEVVMAGIRVRQEMIGWNQELENVSRVHAEGVARAGTGTASDGNTSASIMDMFGQLSPPSAKKVLIEELP